LPSTGTTAAGDLIEVLSKAAHDGWMAEKLNQGIRSRKAAWGEEFMVPYDQLSERAKEIDRSTVRSVLDAIAWAGYRVVPQPRPW